MDEVLVCGAVIAAACAAALLGSALWERVQQRQRCERYRARLAQGRGETGMPRVAGTLFKLRATRRQQARDRESVERDFPFMLDVLTLCLRAGMSFDAAAGLYAERFDSYLARETRVEHGRWTSGLCSREMGLRQLAARFDHRGFARFVSTVLRALRFGTPLTELFSGMAAEARATYRAEREKRVAKAPVKMLIPTGVLILPAMLLLVAGPILLDLLGNLV